MVFYPGFVLWFSFATVGELRVWDPLIHELYYPSKARSYVQGARHDHLSPGRPGYISPA